eukprot:TRINITY_DN475_c0_g1_i15.p1 TRINITY_DN475_c0_g1~~TRINITY_DN475_c0_g1_i15.p1  ORF type:complete len:452 (-),score=150.16 TRINITY_DN475_c0_g1_i15:125-1480(-)
MLTFMMNLCRDHEFAEDNPMEVLQAENKRLLSKIDLLSRQVHKTQLKNSLLQSQLEFSDDQLQQEIGKNSIMQMENALLIEKNSIMQLENALLIEKNSQVQMENAWLIEKNSQVQMENAWLIEKNSQVQMENAWLIEKNSQVQMENARLIEKNSEVQKDLLKENARMTHELTMLEQHFEEIIDVVEIQGNFIQRLDDEKRRAEENLMELKKEALSEEKKKAVLQFTDFNLICLLGSGTNGEVHRAVVNGKTKALKKLQISDLSKAMEVFQEISIAMQVEHPNILPIDCMFVESDNIFLVMEEARSNLSQILQNLQEQDIISMMIQIAQGVQYLHSKKICHRDLKPDNFLVFEGEGEGELLIKIADFGTSERAGIYSDFKGTFEYMCEEIYRMKPYDGYKADIFALAISYEEILTRTDQEQALKRYSNLLERMKNGTCSAAEVVEELMPIRQ